MYFFSVSNIHTRVWLKNSHICVSVYMQNYFSHIRNTLKKNCLIKCIFLNYCDVICTIE